MKTLRVCFLSVLFVIAISVVLSFSPGPARAAPYLAFGMDANHPPTASISYAGGAAPLIGVDISVDGVTGINTPLNNGATLPFVGALNFATGPFIGSDSTHWVFNGGGSINLTADSITVLGGTFSIAAVENKGGDSQVAFGVFSDEKWGPLTDFYGLPTTDYQGLFYLNFSAEGSPPDSFRSLAVLDGVIVNTPVPEPTTMILIGSGLIGLVGLRRKFKK
jgi:hypothetical protein